MHIVSRRDMDISLCRNLIAITEKGIRPCLHVRDVNGRTDRGPAGARRRSDGVLHFLDFMRRCDRDILRDVFAVAFLLVDFCACIRVRLREGREVHHIRCPRKAGVGAACRLEREIEEVFCILSIQSNPAFRIQLRRLARISFRVFLDVRHCKCKTAAATGEADCRAAVPAMELRHVFRSERNSVLIPRARSSKCDIVPCIGFRLRIQHVHADRAIDGRSPRDAACDSRIGNIRCMICRDADRFSCHACAIVNVRRRIGVKRYGRVCQPDACCFSCAQAACTGTLLERRNGFYIRIPGRSDFCTFANMRIRLMHDERFCCSACDTGRAACAKPRRRSRRVTDILGFDRKACAIDFCVISHIGICFLIHYFNGCRKACACRTASRTCPAGRHEFRRILGRNRYCAGIGKLCLICVCNVRIRLITNIRFGIRRNDMEPGCSGTAKVPAACQRRCDGCQVFFGFGKNGNSRSMRQLRTVFNRCIRMPLVRLHICCGTDARGTGKSEPPCHAKKVGFILGLDSNALVSCLIQSLANHCICFLGNDIHSNRAGTGKFCRPQCGTDRHGLCSRITLAVFCRAIVRIIRRNRDTVCLDRFLFLIMSFQ